MTAFEGKHKRLQWNPTRFTARKGQKRGNPDYAERRDCALLRLYFCTFKYLANTNETFKHFRYLPTLRPTQNFGLDGDGAYIKKNKILRLFAPFGYLACSRIFVDFIQAVPENSNRHFAFFPLSGKESSTSNPLYMVESMNSYGFRFNNYVHGASGLRKYLL